MFFRHLPIKTVIMSVLFVVLCTSANTTNAAGANLFLEPATGIFPIGDPFTVEVRIDTGGDVVGTADATIAYETSDLQFVSFSSENSIFSSILVDDTTTAGRINVAGIVAKNRESYSGSYGLFVHLTFIPLRNVATEVRFAQGAATALVASLGELSNMLSSLGAATYTLVPKEVVPTAQVAGISTDGTFEITPLPLPASEWFGSTSVKLSWTIPEDVTEMRTLTDIEQDSVPTKLYQVPVSSALADGLVEGINYFHLQFNVAGEWGEVHHYPLKVDLTPPEYIVVTETQREDASDPRAAFAVEAGDTSSGVARYEMSIDGDVPVAWEPGEDGIYRPEDLTLGEHVLEVFVFDNAGNVDSTEVTFSVKSLEPPILISVPERILTGDTITIAGTSYPNANVTIYISYNEGEASEKIVKSDANGEFVADITGGARAGKYTVWFSVEDERGATSPSSIKRSLNVTQPFIMLFGSVAVTYLSIIVPLIALIILLGLVLWLGFTWVRGYRIRVRRETNEAFDVVKDEFHDLRAELVKQMGVLEKANQSRKLTREEMRIFRDLSKRLDKIESHIEEEIDDIETIDIEVNEEKGVQHHTLDKYATANGEQTQEGHLDSHTVRIEPRK